MAIESKILIKPPLSYRHWTFILSCQNPLHRWFWLLAVTKLVTNGLRSAWDLSWQVKHGLMEWIIGQKLAKCYIQNDDAHFELCWHMGPVSLRQPYNYYLHLDFRTSLVRDLDSWLTFRTEKQLRSKFAEISKGKTLKTQPWCAQNPDYIHSNMPWCLRSYTGKSWVGNNMPLKD